MLSAKKKLHNKKVRMNREKQRILNQRYFKQKHEEDKEKRKSLPDNPIVKPATTNNRAVCKECNIKPRAQGSSRCSTCSKLFKKNKS